MNETNALVALSGVPNLGSIKVRILVQQFSTAEEAYQAQPQELAQLPGFSQKIIDGWIQYQKNQPWKKNLELAEKLGVNIIPYTSHLYPKKLLELHDHPIVLYVKGNIECLNSLAIVGTRNPSIYGQEMAIHFAKHLAGKGFTIISGLARGIDTCAHTGALQQGRTLAVIGSGLANIYPRENIPLANKICQYGAVISEFPMNTPPDRQNFPQRNRIVSGMTLGTLLIEAPQKSGAMITMRSAEQQGRHLYAIPGRADHENFRGNHLLIKQGKAQLVENPNDILNSFNDLITLCNQKQKTQQWHPPLDPEESFLLKTFPIEEISIDDLIKITKLPIMKLNVLLMSLVMKKVVKCFPGRIYKKIID